MLPRSSGRQQRICRLFRRQRHADLHGGVRLGTEPRTVILENSIGKAACFLYSLLTRCCSLSIRLKPALHSLRFLRRMHAISLCSSVVLQTCGSRVFGPICSPFRRTLRARSRSNTSCFAARPCRISVSKGPLLGLLQPSYGNVVPRHSRG